MHPLIFGLMAFGWLHTRMLPRVYENHGTQQNQEAAPLLQTTLSYCALTG